jgi:ABC-type multidrug transport system fused ATPase/permease subunit
MLRSLQVCAMLSSGSAALLSHLCCLPSVAHILLMYCMCTGRVLPMKVIELIKRRPRESPPGDFIPDSGTLQGSLELQGVAFAYPGRPTQRVLNGLSLTVSPGENIPCLFVETGVGVSRSGCGRCIPGPAHTACAEWSQPHCQPR